MNEGFGVYGRKWTEDIEQFIKAELPIYDRESIVQLINNIWDRNFTVHSLSSHCCDRKISLRGTKRRRRQGYSLFAEQLKKGYIRIKTEKGWMEKQRWIYEKAHPEYEHKMGNIFIFLDGNRENFDVKNIELMSRRELAIFAFYGGVVKDCPGLTLVNLLRARLRLKQLDAGEKLGIVANRGHGRRFRSDINRSAREYRRKKRERMQNR